MEVRDRLLDLLVENDEYLGFFRACCDAGHLRLRAQAWQFRAELADRGHEFRRVDVEDALAVLAGELLPESPAAGWDAGWAHEIIRNGLSYLNEWFVEDADLSALADHGVAIDAAVAAEDRFALRRAVRRWAAAGRRLFDAARGEAA